MKRKNYGQPPLQSFEDAFEDAITHTDRPAGMPPHSVIATEVKKLGLPATDADAIYDVWLACGFTLKGGRKIRDFRAALRTWARNEWFPSQRKTARTGPPLKPANWNPPTLDQIKAYCIRKHWSAGFARHCHSIWIANNWRHYGEPIASDEQWKAIMESMDYRP